MFLGKILHVLLSAVASYMGRDIHAVKSSWEVFFMIKSTEPLLPDYFTLHAKWRGKKSALISATESLNWAEFNSRLNQIASGLHALGLKPQDRVVVFMTNGGAMAEVLFGLMVGGFVSAPLNLSVTDEAVGNMIRDCEAKAIIATADHVHRLNRILKAMGKTAPAIRILAEGMAENWIEFEPWRDGQCSGKADVKVRSGDLLNIIYSSGTTGQPKGIAHTHQGRRDWAYDLANALRYNSSARFMATIGLYSNITWVGMLCALLSGGTLIVSRKFDAHQLWQDIENHGVTHLAMVPVMYERMMEVEGHEKYDVSTMQGMMSAGSALRASIREKLFARFDCGITELYGLTEGVITTLDPEDSEGRMSSVGVPILGSDLIILDEEKQICGAGKSGEILMATRFVMPGYLNRDDATSDSLFIDENGQHWLRTGDIGYLDDEGYLYIVDRKKDMILSGGQNIYPQDIEAVMARHDDVIDVAVIGVKSNRWGETPLAIIAPRNGKADIQAIKKWTNERLGKQQRIIDVKIMDAIPRNPNGKILKRDLRQKFKDISYD